MVRWENRRIVDFIKPRGGEECRLLKEFIKFLLKNDAYERYVNALLRSENIEWLSSRYHITPTNYVSDAFDWVLENIDDANNGSYWFHLSETWRDYLVKVGYYY